MSVARYITDGTVVEILAPVTRNQWTTQQIVIEIERGNTDSAGKVWPAKCALFEILTDRMQWPDGYGVGATVRVSWSIADRRGKDGRWWQGRRVIAIDIITPTLVVRTCTEHREQAPSISQASASAAVDDSPMPF